MKVSIVTISYNQAQFLEQAITSVIQQNHPDIEYIVVDAGSTDGSRDIIATYQHKIDKAVLEKDNGAADGLNKGFSFATGNIFGFLNSDDELLPDALARVMDFFHDHPEVDVVSGCGYFIDSKGVRIRRIIPSVMTPWLFVHASVSIFQQGTFFRATAFRKVQGFNIDNKTCWDGELLLDMAVAGMTFALIGDDLAHFRLHEAGITGSGRLEKAYKKDMQRLFIKAMGRERNRLDSLQDIAARVLRGLINPTYYTRRIVSLFTQLSG